MVYNEIIKDYMPTVQGLHGAALTQNTDWLPAVGITEAQHLTAQMNKSLCTLLTDNVSVLLSVAIEFATVGFDSKPAAVKYAGSCKVIAVK